MKNHVYILMADHEHSSFVRGVFMTYNDAVRAREVMKEKKLNVIYSITSYQVWESFDQAQASGMM